MKISAWIGKCVLASLVGIVLAVGLLSTAGTSPGSEQGTSLSTVRAAVLVANKGSDGQETHG